MGLFLVFLNLVIFNLSKKSERSLYYQQVNDDEHCINIGNKGAKTITNTPVNDLILATKIWRQEKKSKQTRDRGNLVGYRTKLRYMCVLQRRIIWRGGGAVVSVGVSLPDPQPHIKVIKLCGGVMVLSI